MRSFNELRRRTADPLVAEGRRLSGGDAVATGNFCNDKSFYLTYGGLCGLLLFFYILLSTVPIVKVSSSSFLLYSSLHLWNRG